MKLEKKPIASDKNIAECTQEISKLEKRIYYILHFKRV